MLLEKTNSRLRAKVYFELLGNVLTDWSSTDNCATLPITYSSPRIRLPPVSYRVVVYVGTLTFYLQPRSQAHIDFQAELCADTGRTLYVCWTCMVHVLLSQLKVALQAICW